MIQVPKEIKELFKSSSVQKNIRIHFPNGEMHDLCNDKLVSESLSFTESICSGDNFSLGLMESPTIEFEVVGVSSFKGATIEVYIEVYCDSSINGAVYKSDLKSYVYSIPYGVFVVDTCKRQADLEHRKVTAYAGVIDESLVVRSDYLSSLNIPWREQKIPVRIHIDDIDKLNFFDVTELTHQEYPESLSETFEITLDTTDSLVVEVDMQSYEIGSPSGAYYKDVTGLVQLTKTFNTYKINGNFNLHKAKSELVENDLVDLYKTYKSGNNDEIRKIIRQYFTKYIYANEEINLPTTFIKHTENSTGSGSVVGDYNKGSLEDNRTYGYDILNSNYGCVFNTNLYELYSKTSTKKVYYESETNNLVRLPVSGTITVSLKHNNIISSDVHTINFDFSTTITSVYSHRKYETYILKSGNASYSVDDSVFKIDFSRTISNNIKRRTQKYNSSHNITDTSTSKRKEYSADVSNFGEIRVRDVMASYAELQGKMGRINRYGKFELITLNGNDGLTPAVGLYPSIGLYPHGPSGGTMFPIDYISCWYEDVNVKPIGRISITYNDVDNENEQSNKTYDIVENFNSRDYKTYTVSGNWILDTCTFTEEQIDEILETMGTYLKDIIYVPCNIDLAGRPFIEVGDFIQVVTTKGDVFVTAIFRRTIKGIQALRDTFEVNVSDDDFSSSYGSSNSGSGISSNISGGYGSVSGVSSVNGYTGTVNLRTSDIENDLMYIQQKDLCYNYVSETKTLQIFGIIKQSGDENGI